MNLDELLAHHRRYLEWLSSGGRELEHSIAFELTRDTVAALEQLAKAENSLRNCLLLANKVLAFKHPDSQGAQEWAAVIRFCKEAGVEPSPTRT